MVKKIPRVGIGVITLNEQGQFLLCQRIASHGAHTWSLAGGHLEFGESFVDCAKREVLEETGLTLENVKQIGAPVTHFFDEGAKHYVTVYCIGTVTGVPKIMEPHKNVGWQFFDDWHNLPQPLFVPYTTDIDLMDIEEYKKTR